MDNDIKKELDALKDRITKLEKLSPSQNKLFGKPQKELGSTSSETVIATLGTLKIRYGNKYVTVFKDGKLVSSGSSLDFVYKVDTVGDKDGIYIIEGEDNKSQLVVVLDGKAYEISSDGDGSISFVNYQKLTQDQREVALKNIGILYSDMNSFNDNGIQDGIIFLQDEGKLYLVKNGEASEFKANVPKEIETLVVKLLSSNQIKIGSTTITENSINSNSTFNIGGVTVSGDQVTVSTLDCNEIIGKNFSITQGNDGTSILTVDTIISSNQSVSQVPKYTSYNAIKSISQNENGDYEIVFQCLYQDNVGDIIWIPYESPTDKDMYYIKYDDSGNMSYYNDEEDYDEDTLDWNEEGKLYLIDKNGNEVIVTKGDRVPKYTLETITTYVVQDILFKSLGQSTFECLSELPDEIDEIEKLKGFYSYLIRKINGETSIVIPLVSIRNNIQLFIPKIDESAWKVEVGIPVCTFDTNPDSCGLILSKPSDSEHIVFAKYSDDSETIPDDANEKTLATIECVKKLASSSLPIGTIIAFHGTTPPKGWKICDGSNGTPNLVGKFIIGGLTESDGNEIDISPMDEPLGTDPQTIKIDPGYYSMVFIMKTE